MKHSPPVFDALTAILKTYKDPNLSDFQHAWVGLEPTFQTKKSVRKWKKLSAKTGGEDAYFRDPYMLKLERKIAKEIKKKYKDHYQAGAAHCPFIRVEITEGHDKWGTVRQKLCFYWADDSLEPFGVSLSLDPETFEYGIKPVPLAWFYDDRFVTFLHEFLWKVPQSLGLTCAIAHGGGEFHFSAKTMMTGSLLADELAYKLNHPELATWIMSHPQCDARAFRATRERKTAYQGLLQKYWRGEFHPRAIGVLTPQNAYLDRGFGPVPVTGRKKFMDRRKGPLGTARDVFQTNFAFARAVRWQAQDIQPGYWQAAHPDDDGYRPDQVMRYSEGNLNRLEIAGELHVKSDEVLEPERVPEFDAPLEPHMLATEASYENRAHMTRTSARDYAEAVLLEVHHLQYLQAHPYVKTQEMLLQDLILADAVKTLERFGGAETLACLRRDARTFNLDVSHGRVKSDWIEPEKLFWASWKVLPPPKKAATACEVIDGFIEHVEQAAKMDPRTGIADPMEWHRHRIHPLLWSSLDAAKSGVSKLARKEREAWKRGKKKYLSRRPVWSQDKDNKPPWK